MDWNIKESGVTAIVEDIQWERIHLNLMVRLQFHGTVEYNPEELEFYAVNNLGECGTGFDVKKLAPDLVQLHVNVTNNGR